MSLYKSDVAAWINYLIHETKIYITNMRRVASPQIDFYLRKLDHYHIIKSNDDSCIDVILLLERNFRD